MNDVLLGLLWWLKEGSTNDDLKCHTRDSNVKSVHGTLGLGYTAETYNKGLLEMTERQMLTSLTTACNRG